MLLTKVVLAFCLSGLALARGHREGGGGDNSTTNAAAEGGAERQGHHRHNGTNNAATQADTQGGRGHHGHQKNGTETVATQSDIEGDHKRNGTKGDSQNAECHEMTRLTRLTDLANNATKLTELETKRNLTSAQIDEIKTAAANATTRLTELKSNTTLVSQCIVVNADMQLKHQCHSMKRLTKLADLASNASTLSDFQTKKNLTVAEMDEIKAKVKDASAKLQELKSNATLVTACQSVKDEDGKRNKTGDATTTGTAVAAQASTSGSKAKRVEKNAAGFHVLANGLSVTAVALFVALLMM